MIVNVYLHSNKESMYERGETFGLKDEALKTFAYALFEVKVTLDVDADGLAEIIAVDGRRVESRK